MKWLYLFFGITPHFIVPIVIFYQDGPLWAWLLYFYSLASHFLIGYLDIRFSEHDIL